MPPTATACLLHPLREVCCPIKAKRCNLKWQADSLCCMIYLSFTSLSTVQFLGLTGVSFVNHKRTSCQGKMKQFPPVSTTAQLKNMCNSVCAYIYIYGKTVSISVSAFDRISICRLAKKRYSLYGCVLN